MKINYVMSEDGDWEGLYVNGKLKCEGHSLPIWDIMNALGLKYEHKVVDFEEYDISSLPDDFKDLK